MKKIFSLMMMSFLAVSFSAWSKELSVVPYIEGFIHH